MCRTKLLLFFLSISCALCAQNADSLVSPTVDLGLLEIKATRIATNALQLPYSIAVYSASGQQLTRQQLSLQEYLSELPGLFSQNANNYAQDLRIAIRGFGSRAAFGIRGVKVIVDGIPETTPDGQGQIDNLNLGNVDRIEVIKGPSAALYGNAAGGILQLYSKTDFDKNYLAASIGYGSFDMQQYQLKTGWTKNKTKVLLHGTHTQGQGFRTQSKLVNTSIDLRLLQTFSTKGKMMLQANYTNSPIGDDPGGLTAAEVESERSQARDRNITFQTGESIQQFKVGGTYNQSLTANQNIKSYAFYNRRQFEGRLPFSNGGWINLTRDYAGHGTAYELKHKGGSSNNVLQIGYELAVQRDHRQRYFNLDGQQGNLTLDQFENFSNGALYLVDHFYLKKWVFTVGLRWDANRLDLADNKLDDGDQSSEKKLPALNPSIGINYNFAKRLHLYASYRTSFETPSLSELSANPTGEAGFNPDLQSQQATNYELGLKGLVSDRFDFDLTAFYIQANQELRPFELMEFPGRNFYRNSGTTRRFGIESWGRYQFNTFISSKLSYTFSDFRFDDAMPSPGNFLPGLPAHTTSLSLRYQNDDGWSIRLQQRYVGKMYADDLNETSIPAYHLTDCSLGYRLKNKHSIWMPFLGINNIFSSRYNDNLRINAFGGRYYEPAAGVNVYGGLRWRIQ